MAIKGQASRKIHFVAERKDYAIVVLPNAVCYDSNNNPSAENIVARVYRVINGQRSVLAVNNAAGASHWLIAVTKTTGGTESKTPLSSVGASSVASVTSLRFDLVEKAKVTVSGSNYTYDESDIITSQAVPLVHDGTQGAKPVNVFCRNATKPNAPQGGTYANPYPDGWSDTPPSDNPTSPKTLWMSTNVFEANGSSRGWTDPSPVADGTDIEYIFTSINPYITPENTHPHDDCDPDEGDGWGKNPDGAIYMAIAKKSGGAWGAWSVVRIKGESAVTVVVTPTNIVAHNGLLLGAKVDVKVYDESGEHNAGGLGPLTTLAEAGKLNAETGVKWSFYNQEDIFGYILNGTLKKDVTYNSFVTYKNVQYPFTLQLTKADDGQRGDKGDDAVAYSLVLTPSSVRYDLNTETYSDTSVNCRVNRTKGENEVTDVTNNLPSGFTLTYACEYNGAMQAEKTCNGVVVFNNANPNKSPRYGRIDFILKKGGLVVARETLMIGVDGLAGRAGAMTLPPMPWDEYDDSYEFQDGTTRVNPIDGPTHHDVVYWTRNADGKWIVYSCIKSHLKSLAVAEPGVGTQWRTYWVANSGPVDIIASKVILGDNGFIGLFGSNAIRIYNSARQIVGQMSSADKAPIYQGHALPFFIGGLLGELNFDQEPRFAVDEQGRTYHGGITGRHIEIDPISKTLRMFDDDNRVSFLLTGDRIEPGDVTSGNSQSVSGNGFTVSHYATGAKPSPQPLFTPITVNGASGTCTVNIPKMIFMANGGSNPPANFGISGTLKVSVYVNNNEVETYITGVFAGVDGDGNDSSYTINPLTYHLPVKKNDVVSATVTVEGTFTNCGSQCYTQVMSSGGGASASVVYSNQQCIIANNGFIFSVNSDNYVYFLTDKNGILKVGCVAGGHTVFSS